MSSLFDFQEPPRPLVSVWMITYNHARYIRQALESVMMQETDFPIEVIIGDDCSTDGTQEIIREFEQRYPAVIKPIYHQVNVGAYRNAYEFCYPRLSGKYIACLEGDDYWLNPYKLQLQVTMLERNSRRVLCFSTVQVLRESTGELEPHWSVKLPPKDRYSLTDILKTFNIVTCSLVFRHVYPVLPYDPLRFPTGDVSLCAFLLLKGYGVCVNLELAVYREHGSGAYSPLSLENKNLVFLKIFEQLLVHPQFTAYRNLLKRLLADRAYQALCFEIKKRRPSKPMVKDYETMATYFADVSNLWFPFKAWFRRRLFLLTGKSFGRQLE